jgi:RNA polymerase sigma-70 factor (ECF subfamily)
LAGGGFAPSAGEPGQVDTTAAFEAFVRTHGRSLQRAFVARFGVEVGNDVAAEALGVAWERWDEVAEMANPLGFLYRVGQSRSRRFLRWGREPSVFPGPPLTVEAPTDHLDLLAALGRLREPERVAVLLVHAYGWSYADVASLLDVPVTAVNNHIHRGMARLRSIMEVDR